jgi:dTDP-4-amino-4,6-dideoxygalactose transaminase
MLCEAIDARWLSSSSPFLDELEKRFAERISVRYAVAASSGTAALHLALCVLVLEKNDEVIVPDFTMISPVLAVLACGGIPVPLDADDCFPWPAWWGDQRGPLLTRPSKKAGAFQGIHGSLLSD